MNTMQTQKAASSGKQEKEASDSKWKQLSKGRKILFVLTLLLVLGIGSNILVRIFTYRVADGSAAFKISNGQTYLEIDASDPYDIGYLTGIHLSQEILALKSTLLLMSPQFGSNYLDLKSRALEFLPFIDASHLEEMHGMAAGASHRYGIPISFHDILIQNTFMDIAYGQLIPSHDLLGCTAIVANNTEDNLIFGQNFDFNKIFQQSVSFVLVKNSDAADIFTIRFGGMLALPIGKNANNVSALTTVVKVHQTPDLEMPLACRSRIAFESARNSSGFFEAFFADSGANSVSGFNMMIVDENTSITVDKVPGLIHTSSPDYTIRTNTFINESWQHHLIDKDYSKERQAEAEEQFSERGDGSRIDYVDLMDLLSSKPIICQTADSLSEVATLAFFSNEHFGIGNPSDDYWGEIPF